ncbi:MAG: Gfo/Idh/MocA family oxidoreductase [Candidatus Brocadiaceae bacterium]|jgi:predicted dehydrogenase
MRIGFHGQLLDHPEARVGFIGCGSHAFRNLFPALQFVPLRLVATCDLDREKARVYAERFGAESHYGDFREMLDGEELDGVLICTGYGKDGRPTHARLAAECLRAGCHAWMEKPPAASCAEIEDVQEAERESGKFSMVGLKTMFFQANEKALELTRRAEFGTVNLITLRRPVNVPPTDELSAYLDGENVGSALRFLDHICHVTSLLLLFAGMPETMYYERTPASAAVVTFRYGSGTVATMALTEGASYEGGIEQSMIVGEGGHHVLVDNNIRVEYHRGPARPEGQGYGSTPSHFTGPPEATTAVWHPEFSLGQLYSKALFTQGFYGEINEFARAVLEERRPAKSHSEHAWQVTRIFEAFAEGPGKVIRL